MDQEIGYTEEVRTILASHLTQAQKEMAMDALLTRAQRNLRKRGGFNNPASYYQRTEEL